MHWLDGFSRICIVGGYFLALWKMDAWVIIWTFLERFRVSVCCFVYFIISSVIFMYEELCCEFTMLGLIVEIPVFGKGTVAEIELHV